MRTIVLPARAKHLPDYCPHLNCDVTDNEICLDFQKVAFVTPGNLVWLIAAIHWWNRNGQQVSITNHASCNAFTYLQRVNFFDLCGIEIQESFTRRDHTGRFVPLAQIGQGGTSIESVSTEMATCIAPEMADMDDPDQSGLFDFIQYSISEMASNVVQHSRSAGFVSAQYFSWSDTTSIAIADYGIGIRGSFVEAGWPGWGEADDASALLEAVKPKVSSKGDTGAWGGNSGNAGVGLTMLKELAASVGGQFTLISGNGVYDSRKIVPARSCPARIAGTICEIKFPRSAISNFYGMLTAAKTKAGLLSGRDYGGMFQ